MRHEMDKIEDRHVLSFSATKTELGSFDTGIPSTCQKEKLQVVEITGLKNTPYRSLQCFSITRWAPTSPYQL